MTTAVRDARPSPRQWSVGPLTGPALSANHRPHWSARADRTAQWRQQAGWAARAAGIPHLTRMHVVVEWLPTTAGRRDPGNIAPAAKACVDGLVDAGVVTDDDSAHVVGPDLRLGQRHQPPVPARGMWTLRITVTELGETE